MYILSSHEVHICSACLSENKSDISYLVSLLSEDERHMASKFRYAKDQRNFITSRGMLRCLLGGYLKKEPQDIEIVYGLWGKPCLVEKPLYFNLSHSRDHVLYAIARDYEIGIDIEYIDHTFDLALLVSSILSSQERVHWENTKSEDKVNTFFKLWVCKEAFLKAFGKGWISDPQITVLQELDCFKNDAMGADRLEKMKYPFYLEILPGYASALFIDGPFLQPFFYTWSLIKDSLR
ncbi:MAG: hypothetical protein BGO67_10275 [Alphaproteobacteria bacterium 41-28]|nr:MAG: hypothetical protein BGO67_10275 [Alphaproteobacteria bacterium 41-28]